MDYVLVLVAALAIDVVLGEPPSAVHPVVWMGRVISWQLKLHPRGKVTQFVYGVWMVLVTVALFAMPTYFLLVYIRDIHIALFVVVGAVLLKSTFSLRELHRAAMRVKRPLVDGDLSKARCEVKALVSRDTGTLEEQALVSCAVESVAENTSDSFVSPVFYFLLLGVPGAIAYRVCNTFDAMIGYHGEYEYLGKFAAKLDDVLNFVPARLCGVVTVLAACFSRKRAVRAWHVMWRDHGKTESPNAGWTMAAAAGALGIVVEKQGHYRLGDPLVPLGTAVIDQAAQIMWISAAVWSAFSIAVLGVVYVFVS